MKKDYHIPALLEAFNLPNNYFDNLKDSQKVLKIVNLLRKHGQSENLLVEPNGKLNKREDVIHTFNPDSRLYVGFEKWQEFDDSFFITYYRMTEEKTDKLTESMKDPNWDKNVGLSNEQRQVESKIRAQARRKKEFLDLFKGYFPTIAPTDKLSNRQINEIPRILAKSLQSETDKLTPKEIEILQRFDAIDKGWQAYLDSQLDNFSPEHEFRNLLQNQNVTDPKLLLKQIKEIVGPTLDDVE